MDNLFESIGYNGYAGVRNEKILVLVTLAFANFFCFFVFLFFSKQTLIVALSSSRGERIVDLSFANDVFSLFSIHAYATEPIKPALY